MALTKADLTQKLMEGLGMNKPTATLLVDQFFAEIKASLARGQAVKLSGFGNYALKEKKPRPGRNPKTGEDIAVTARRVVTFKPGRKLKRTVCSQGKS